MYLLSLSTYIPLSSAMITNPIAERVMNAHVLCIDDNPSRATDRQKDLEDAGFVVINACDETEAVELLRSRPVDVVCVDSRLWSTDKSRVASKIKNVRPDVLIILICEWGMVPPCFWEHVDVVIDEPDFKGKAQWLIEELRDVHFPFFVEWFDDWKRRAADATNNEPSTFAGTSANSDILKN
jgi:response regulator receiver domain-containing protein